MFLHISYACRSFKMSWWESKPFSKSKMRVIKISMNVRSIKTNHHSKGHTDLLKGSEPIVHINY